MHEGACPTWRFDWMQDRRALPSRYETAAIPRLPEYPAGGTHAVVDGVQGRGEEKTWEGPPSSRRWAQGWRVTANRNGSRCSTLKHNRSAAAPVGGKPPEDCQWGPGGTRSRPAGVSHCARSATERLRIRREEAAEQTGVS
ncbi:hypothetical protein NDU88_004616 [Pleurodeles waltl]|uniref:Uncharacterized protein n=1 Tax=Pleurodeles waltl TaxID=8319 RepID=A0AAV7T8A0_PLEWA|nr:hypothetical protein NDU88_004616 [Pleurodeles waltl]